MKFATKINKEREDGFTLIEMLVVILILGILSAIAIPAFMNQRKIAFDTSLKSDIRSTALAIETWQVKNSSYIADMPVPTDSAGWSIVIYSSPEDLFVGTKNLSGEHIPDGFVKPQLSKGNAIGVLTQKAHTKKGYCIVGNASDGTYSLKNEQVEGVSRFANALYYDSIAGGLYEPNNIPADGACKLYSARISQGI